MEKPYRIVQSSRIPMEKVLIVEDSKVFARILIRKIEDELFFNVCWASNYEEALHIIEENPNNDTFFVALLDLHLPDAADAALYKAKRTGRNRVVWAD